MDSSKITTDLYLQEQAISWSRDNRRKDEEEVELLLWFPNADSDVTEPAAELLLSWLVRFWRFHN